MQTIKEKDQQRQATLESIITIGENKLKICLNLERPPHNDSDDSSLPSPGKEKDPEARQTMLDANNNPTDRCLYPL